MSTITVVTSADQAEALLAQASGEDQPNAEKDSAPAKEQGEKIEASETSENDLSDEAEESAESDESEDSQEDSDKKPKKNAGFKKKIGKLTRRISEKEREIEYWKQEALKNSGQLQEKPETETPKLEAKVDDGRPKAEQFDTHEEYVEALTDWKIDQREQKKAEKAKVEETQTAFQKKQQAHQQKLAEFKKTQADFDEVVNEFIEEQGGTVTFSHALEEAILESDMGPALVYELFKNPKEYARINSMGVVALNKEIGKLEERLSKSKESSAEKKEFKTTSAPKPPQPVGSKGGSVKKSIYDPNLSQREYEQLRAEQERARV